MNICRKNEIRYFIFVILLYSVGGISDALALEVFTRSQVNRNSVDIGEPCIITLSVYTGTWFDQGVVFPEMCQQQGVLLKKGRSYTLQETFGNKRYSIVRQEYWYYPFCSGSQSIVFEDINVSSPKPGEYKGTLRKLAFQDLNIKVRSVGTDWEGTICRRLDLRQRWENADTLDIGGVISREVTYTAAGVPAAFIVPAFSGKNTEGFRAVAEYPQFVTNKYEYGISGEARQRILYQFTDTGNIELPALKAVYWNLSGHCLDTVAAEGKCVYVRPYMGKGEDMSQTVHKAGEDTGRNDRSYGIDECIVWMVWGGIIYMAVRFIFKKYHLALLLNILFCRNPYRMYDLLYIYAVKYTSFHSFGALASSSPRLKEWYENRSGRLFGSHSERKVSFHERLSFLYCLTGVLIGRKLKPDGRFGIKV